MKGAGIVRKTAVGLTAGLVLGLGMAGESFGEIQGLDQAVEEKEDLNDLLRKGRLPIDKVPALISQWFEGASDFAQREAESPQSRMIAYAVAGVIGLLVVIMLVRRMTRKPTQREEPHV